MKVIQLTDEFTANEGMPILEVNSEEGTATIKGRCLPESASEMQKQLDTHLDPCLVKGKLHFTFSLEFFNTSSSKVIELFLNKMEEFHSTGGDMKVKWCFAEEDEDMEEAGEEFATLVAFPFELVAYSE